MSDFFRQWARDIKDEKSGKIWHDAHCGWVLGDNPYVNPQGVKAPVRTDQDGQTMTIAKGRFVTNCPSPPYEGAPRLTKGFSVRRAACDKCCNRLPGMCCSILKERGKDAGFRALKCIQEAVSEATKLVGGGP